MSIIIYLYLYLYIRIIYIYIIHTYICTYIYVDMYTVRRCSYVWYACDASVRLSASECCTDTLASS